jgi:hypothetical protein
MNVQVNDNGGGKEWRALGTCPQCGGEVETIVGDPLIDCGYCRTASYAVCATGAYLSYRLPPAPEYANEEYFHLPYWRLRGLRYRLFEGRDDAVVGNLIDKTAPATTLLPQSANLGIRPQATSLYLTNWPTGSPRADYTPGSILNEADLDSELEDGEGFLMSQLIGEKRVIIHAPYMLTEKNGHPVLRELFPDGHDYTVTPDEAANILALTAAAPNHPPMKFLSLVCPNCAHSLPHEHGAEILLCSQCATAWWPRGAKFKRMPFALLGAREAGDTLIPFWQIDFSAEEIGLKTRADLNRWTIPYRLVKPEWEDEGATMLVPGIKLPPRTFMRLAKTSTLFFTGDHASPRLEKGVLDSEPVRMPLSEAVEAIPLALAQMAMDKRKRIPLIASARIEVTRARLLFIPFTRQGRELRHRASGQAISTGALTRGANL